MLNSLNRSWAYAPSSGSRRNRHLASHRKTLTFEADDFKQAVWDCRGGKESEVQEPQWMSCCSFFSLSRSVQRSSVD
jgi:hypothetical protein